jgi:glutamate synthase domain-containing protein 2
MSQLQELLITLLMIIAGGFFLGLFVLTLLVIYAYLRDSHQSTHAIRRNYPVIGRFRYLFEFMGSFFRQYFFAMDREEMPFNRAQRSWVYRAAKNIDSTVAFGSTRNIYAVGAISFSNHPFPALKESFSEPAMVTIGPDCKHPYQTNSLINISAMSYGAISKPAVKALAKGAKLAGCWMNTGEGGVTPYHLDAGCDLVAQIGTAKYGFRDKAGQLSDLHLKEVASHPQVKMFELKLSQGAKPGKGGILPADKVTDEIASIRGIPPGQDSLSPNGHRDIRNFDDLLEKLHHIREVTGKPAGFKAVFGSEKDIDSLIACIVDRGTDYAPDFITVDSADGGTGAAPQSLIDYVGMSVRESLPLLIDQLENAGLHERIKVIASGKLIEPADVAWALACGADFVNSARGFMFALGCIQALKCNKNICPTGITTHDPKLQRGLDPMKKAIRVCNYVNHIVLEVSIIAHSCGVTDARKLKRQHVRLMQVNGRSVALGEIYSEGK